MVDRNLTTKELIIQLHAKFDNLEEKVANTDKKVEKHMSRHFQINCIIIGSAVTSIFGILVAVIKLIA